jgi:hypothetical protein
MKKIFLIMIMAYAGLLSSSCTYDKIEAKPLPDTVSYKDDIQPIWDQKCMPCHSSSGGIDPDLTAENSYNSLHDGGFVIANDADGSELYKQIASGSMPPGNPLPQDQIDLVKKWINDGALNN